MQKKVSFKKKKEKLNFIFFIKSFKLIFMKYLCVSKSGEGRKGFSNYFNSCVVVVVLSVTIQITELQFLYNHVVLELCL